MNEKSYTKVYVTGTKKCDCITYKNLCPEQNKIGAIKTLLRHGYDIINDWGIFHIKIERIKQLLIHNSCPMKLIDETLNKLIGSKFKMKINCNSIIENR